MITWLSALILGVLGGVTAREFYEFVIKRGFKFLRQKIKQWIPVKKPAAALKKKTVRRKTTKKK